jgi:hypothetical protein
VPEIISSVQDFWIKSSMGTAIVYIKLFKIDQSGDGSGWNHHNSELRLFPVPHFTFLRTPENTLLGS